MAQRLMSSGKSIFRALNLNHLGGGAAESRPFIRALAPANLKRKASNSFSAIQDTYFSTKEVFESHRVVFTIGTSIASILTAWAGYSLRQHHHSNVERRLESIEKAMMKNYNVEREEIKRIVGADNVSTTACIATAGTSLIVGYGLGWRGGLWFANRKFRREQLKQLGQVKSRGWQSLRSPFVRFRKKPSLNNTVELTGNTSATSVPS
ncbi:uncharacterized protein LOC110108253 [Dendrobium catenatum]|uniref:Triacylglycerol lipase 2 n=1 Tax=Dendrobium catenatum TaxID=906689 RepID=A0A2I0W509_9ASPA|nr:uncharacterized protein LOC110108253 [Dendrobium catenatum]PKU70749.1 hypothetical protein MA16_Dca012502 [Dendrobium catenatum]